MHGRRMHHMERLHPAAAGGTGLHRAVAIGRRAHRAAAMPGPRRAAPPAAMPDMRCAVFLRAAAPADTRIAACRRPAHPVAIGRQAHRAVAIGRRAALPAAGSNIGRAVTST